MYAEHWRKLEWTTFSGNFPMLVVQQFCGALMDSGLLEYATVFSIKKQVSTGYFRLFILI